LLHDERRTGLLVRIVHRGKKRGAVHALVLLDARVAVEPVEDRIRLVGRNRRAAVAMLEVRSLVVEVVAKVGGRKERLAVGTVDVGACVGDWNELRGVRLERQLLYAEPARPRNAAPRRRAD